ncbi:probable bifunctional dTTP/UTP pyrophosphatase/methyltransferase protein isoform X1 [Pocillopora verrucosa]|uniref:probable bifunctional dTTP/UTP pyrophosphatase/methyltransferase protein isoform X1 n=1 Tax=Pocillopora verrucosa TaxID=203993 RepID=UPI003342B43C
MLEPLLEVLSAQRVILASSSPRRCEILRKIGLKFEVIPSRFEETLDKTAFKYPFEYVLENSRQKALEVAGRVNKSDKPTLIIGSDTVVVLDEVILEKPKDKENAYSMLKSLSGKDHAVFSGVTLLQREGAKEPCITQFYEETLVSFGTLTDEVIQAYIATGEPMDKAGSYGIQGIGGTLVKSIHGDYFNVMGFPLYHFCVQMRKLFSDSSS